MDELPPIPLLALPDRVCFPGAELELVLTEPAHRRLVLDLAARESEARWLGVVLRREGATEPAAPFFHAGTLARLEAFTCNSSEGIEVRLRGAVAFLVEEALTALPYPSARVRLLREVGEAEPCLLALCRELAELARRAPDALAELTPERLPEVLARPHPEMVNRLAQSLAVPPLRKLELLTYPLPERAHHVAGILRSRARLGELLAPYRHLATGVESN